MANRAAPFTQADVTRAVKGAIAAGLKVREVITTLESIRVVCGEGKAEKPEANPWDEALDG